MDLLELFRNISSNRSGIKLLNIYKGLPITYNTRIVTVGNSEILVPGSRSHIACMYYQGESYLQGEELPFIVRSKVKSLNLAQDYAILTSFEVMNDDIGKRAQIRVVPDDPLIATVQFKGSAFEFLAPIADISASGACVFFESYMFPSRLSQPGSELTMTLTIPDFVVRKIKKPAQRTVSDGRRVTAPLASTLPTDQDGQIVITANGRIISIRPDVEQKRYRVSAQLYFKDLSRMVVLQYISHRQAEIIKDLRLFAEDLYSRKK